MKNKESIITNAMLILFEIIGISLSIIIYHKYDLIYYTQDSNLLSLIASIIYLVYSFKDNIPKWVSILKYISVLGLTVTFLVALFILTPMYDFNITLIFFEPTMLFHHLICPVVAFISFVFFEKHDIKGWKDSLRACYFTIIYAVVTVLLNVLKIIKGPYPFLFVYENPIYISILFFFVIVVGSFGVSSLIRRIKR